MNNRKIYKKFREVYWVFILTILLLILIYPISCKQHTETTYKTVTYELGSGVQMEFVLIHPGSFMMGGEDAKPVHKVKITKPFYLGKFEVTQAQYQAVMGNNPSVFKGESNLPVENITWYDCQEFLKKLNEKICGKEFRLPTEAEWEYACRASSTTEYCFGDSEDDLGQYAWFAFNSDQKTHPVGEKNSNAWGLYDMHGNVWEWCNDYYSIYHNIPAEDPKGPKMMAFGTTNVIRGGSFSILLSSYCRSSTRMGVAPNVCWGIIGFRVCFFSSDL